jgi:hypothetical protein
MQIAANGCSDVKYMEQVYFRHFSLQEMRWAINVQIWLSVLFDISCTAQMSILPVFEVDQIAPCVVSHLCSAMLDVRRNADAVCASARVRQSNEWPTANDSILRSSVWLVGNR